jgi:hypothetical protein
MASGLRPERVEAVATTSGSMSRNPDKAENQHTAQAGSIELVRQIEALEEPLGKGLYRGLLKTVARVWRPSQIHDLAVLRKVLAHMQAAERGLRRLEVAAMGAICVDLVRVHGCGCMRDFTASLLDGLRTEL